MAKIESRLRIERNVARKTAVRDERTLSSNLGATAIYLVMLGVRENGTVITGIYAQKMRDALRRKYTDSPNEEDLRAKERSEKIKSEYNAIWV